MGRDVQFRERGGEMGDHREKDRPAHERDPQDERDPDDVPTVPPTEPEPAPIKEPPAPEKPSGYTVGPS